MPTAMVRLTGRLERGVVRVLPVAEGAPVPRELRPAANEAMFAGRRCEVAEVLASTGRTLLVGLGDQGETAGRNAGAQAAARLLTCETIAIDARGFTPNLAAALGEGACLRAWWPPHRRLHPDADAVRLARIDLLVDDPVATQATWDDADAGVQGTTFARDLVAEPSDTLTPAAFAKRMSALEAYGIEVEVLRPRDLRAAKLGLLLAVGEGSANRPRLVVLRWAGSGEGAPVAFVGKGITFDTGGICIKPADRMWEMRGDMAGAAACVGAMLALARRRSPMPAVAVLPLAENATGAESYRPGDVLRGVSGRTVEIVDTDAEGRLVLADALAYAVARFSPRAAVTVATLTGAIVLALGHHRAGLFHSSPGLAEALETAARDVGEPVWTMPIGRRHREDIDSVIADLRHCLPGRMQPDACQAAAFIREFADGTPWAHLDIAGVESRECANDAHAAGATGFGARLLAALPGRLA